MSMTRRVHHREYRHYIDSQLPDGQYIDRQLNQGSLVPFRHTYNASRII
jgi:hypothetical protein